MPDTALYSCAKCGVVYRLAITNKPAGFFRCVLMIYVNALKIEPQRCNGPLIQFEKPNA